MRQQNIRLLLLLGCVVVLVACEGLQSRLLAVETVAPADLTQRLREPDPPVVVDVRAPATFQQGHVPGSVSLPPDQALGWLQRPDTAPGRLVVVVCNHGYSSLHAAALLRDQGHRRVLSLQGGFAAWRQAGLPEARGPGPSPPADALRPPQARLDLFQQIVSTTSGLGLKPAYMLLTLALVLWLRRARARDLTLIRWGLGAFLAGEAGCMFSFLLAGGSSFWLECIHGAGMAVMGALVPWGLFLLVDGRVLRFTHPTAGCACRRLCGACWKTERVSCAPYRLFWFVAVAAALLALLPWTTPIRSVYAEAQVFLTHVRFAYPVTLQLVDFRLYPTLAAAALLLTLPLLAGGRPALHRAQVPFFVGLGALSFSLLRFVLAETTRSAPWWADFWEELTELLSILLVALVLWFFRQPLGLARGRRAPPAAAPDPERDAGPPPAPGEPDDAPIR